MFVRNGRTVYEHRSFAFAKAARAQEGAWILASIWISINPEDKQFLEILEEDPNTSERRVRWKDEALRL